MSAGPECVDIEAGLCGKRWRNKRVVSLTVPNGASDGHLEQWRDHSTPQIASDVRVVRADAEGRLGGPLLNCRAAPAALDHALRPVGPAEHLTAVQEARRREVPPASHRTTIQLACVRKSQPKTRLNQSLTRSRKREPVDIWSQAMAEGGARGHTEAHQVAREKEWSAAVGPQ